MSKRIAVVAPGRSIDQDVAARIKALAGETVGPRAEIVFHPQCFLKHGHFAGDDAARAAAFVEAANDPNNDAVWFARGGYGSCRIAETVLPKLNDAARGKTYLAYSDGGTLLAGLYARGFAHVAHGPMPIDIVRQGGDAAVKRALLYLTDGDRGGVEANVSVKTKSAAFNITILSHLIGTPLQPDLSGHVLMLEDVSEYMYRIDRALCHILANPAMRAIAGVRLGRVSDVPENDPPFGLCEEDVTRHWCDVAGVPYLGRADIGHDVDNRIVPFGVGAAAIA